MQKFTQPEFFQRRVIKQSNGNVLHALKNTDDEFLRFGEVYISKINKRSIKGWKKHNSAHLNLVVTSGDVRFVALAESAHDAFKVLDIRMSEANHGLLVVPPGFWLAFGAYDESDATIINISTEVHDPNESVSVPFEVYKDHWTANETELGFDEHLFRSSTQDI